MTSMLVCTSHAPLALFRERAPEGEDELIRQRTTVRSEIERFDPELIFLFGVDHFSSFHYACMPPYCIGFAAEAVEDLGGFAGTLNVDRAQGMALVEALRREGFDPAVSYKMEVDHAFSQPLHLLTGAIDRYPVVPIFISAFTPPFVPFARSRALGEAVGRFVAESGLRILLIGTGGLSHHPAHYFPPMEDASPDVLSYQMEGARGGLMSDADWLGRFDTMHRAGAKSAANGERGRKEMRMQPELDQEIIATIGTNRQARYDGWKAEDVVAQAGVGMLELHTWIAASAAFGDVPDRATMASVYNPAVEYGTGYGLLYSRPSMARQLAA